MPSRIPGMKGRSYRRPVCSQGADHSVRRNENDEWFCVECFDAWLGEYRHGKVGNQTVSGIELPSGVTDPDKPSILEVLPNRATRRAMRRLNGSRRSA